MAQLPRANVRQQGEFPPEEFEFIADVPVFAEHQTTGKDGRELAFGMAELSAVTKRCNQRIEQSGDYAVVCFGHTPNPDEAKPMPELCGYAGPFRMGQLGKDNRPAILADFHILKEDMARFKKHPRRSPEVWLEDEYEDMFLDPIALLSAECPRLDMGLLYSAVKNGRIVEKYTAAAPAAGNTFIPSGPGDKRYAADTPANTGDTSMNLSSDDIRAILEGIDKQDWMVELKQMIAERHGANTSDNMPLEGPPAEAPMAATPEAPAPMPEAPPLGPGPAAPPMEAPAAEAPMGNAPPAEEPPMEAPPAAPEAPMPEAPKEEEEAEKYPKPYAANEQGPYQDGTESDSSDGKKVEHDLGSPLAYAAKCTCGKEGCAECDKTKTYAAMDTLSDDEVDDYARQRKRRKKHFQADAEGVPAGSTDETSETAVSSNPTVEPDNPGPSASSGSVDDTDESTGEYQGSTGTVVVPYSRDGEVDKLRKELEVERFARVTAERYTKLSPLHEIFTFDLEEESTSCAAGEMSDTQFDAHLERIKTRYQRRPIAHGFDHLPTHAPGAAEAAAQSPDRPGAVGATERYSKSISDRARAICLAARAKGEDTDYRQVLQDVANGSKTE